MLASRHESVARVREKERESESKRRQGSQRLAESLSSASEKQILSAALTPLSEE